VEKKERRVKKRQKQKPVQKSTILVARFIEPKSNPLSLYGRGIGRG